MKKWEIAEEVVTLLEQAISPGAKVERNVQLPNLTDQGEKCQCDVVIRNGQPPRETISIVEVQDRGSKVKINTFRGWCMKMRDVGAQHLICVSEKGFPRSIRKKALKMGPTVRLLTLTQLESKERWPLDFFSNVVQNPRRELTKVFNVELRYKNEKNTEPVEFDVKLDAPDFQYNGRWVSSKELFFAHLNYLEDQGNVFEDGKHTIKMQLPMDDDELFFRMGSSLKKVLNLSASYEMDILNRKMQLVASQYKQIAFGSVVAWLMEASVYMNDEEREIKFVFVPLESGSYRLVSIIN